MDQWLECVPNFSEGVDQEVLEEIAETIRDVSDVFLLEVDPGVGANRTVFTFAGLKEAMGEAAFRAIRVATKRIDMSEHKGVHPRIGAVDVCPFIPLRGSTIKDCVEVAHNLGKQVAEELEIPGYFYGEAAKRPDRKNLANCRKGEYEGIQKKLEDANWQPDFGPNRFHPKAGMTVIGARNFLIAYNLNLDTDSVDVAKKIAEKVRASGKSPSTNRLQAVKAIGWKIPEYKRVQISTNLIDFQTNGMAEVWYAVAEEAQKLGVKLTGSELVGLIPVEALVMSGRKIASVESLEVEDEEGNWVDLAVQKLGLDELRPFPVEKKVLEYVLRDAKKRQ